MHGETIKVK